MHMYVHIYIYIHTHTTSCSSTTDNSVAAVLCCTQPGLCGCAPMASRNALDVWVLEQETVCKLPSFPFLSWFQSKIQEIFKEFQREQMRKSRLF